MGEMIDTRLRSEVLNLFQYIQRLREEIAATTSDDGNGTAFDDMAVQLGAIVEATESATHSILKAAETISTVAASFREGPDPEDAAGLCDELDRSVTEIMEACTFQDITGQRISRIVGSLKFVEERIGIMVDIAGREAIQTAGQDLDESGGRCDKPELKGPQLPGEAITQEEIDALFD